jgi:hypothetical protein
MSNFPDPKKVLIGTEMREDLGLLIGYCIGLGWQENIMPSEHAVELLETFLAKYDRPAGEREE